jgi:hypothetical protein
MGNAAQRCKVGGIPLIEGIERDVFEGSDGRQAPIGRHRESGCGQRLPPADNVALIDRPKRLQEHAKYLIGKVPGPGTPDQPAATLLLPRNMTDLEAEDLVRVDGALRADCDRRTDGQRFGEDQPEARAGNVADGCPAAAEVRRREEPTAGAACDAYSGLAAPLVVRAVRWRHELSRAAEKRWLNKRSPGRVWRQTADPETADGARWPFGVRRRTRR